MFENLLKELKKLENTSTISVPIKNNEKRYLDRQCPSDKCLYRFKVLGIDWKNKFKEKAVCPKCGISETLDKWHTTKQIEYAKEKGLEQLQQRIIGALEADAQKLNSSQRKSKSFLKMSMKVESKKFEPTIILNESTEPFETIIKCDNCSVKYSVVGTTSFCPCCEVNTP